MKKININEKNPVVEQIADLLGDRYKTAGYSRHLFYTDRGLLRRANKHPKDITHEDIETIIMQVDRQKTKALYRTRFKSMFNSFREMGIVSESHDPLKKVPKIKAPRGLPRPFTKNEVEVLLTKAEQPMRDMFTLSCYAGMRAMEIAQVRGVDLEEQADGYYIRIPNGKGRTDLSLPAHPLIIDVIKKHKTLGRLWEFRANDVSIMCNTESRRLGIDKKLHSGRHFFATNAYAASGGDLLAVCKLMRHSSVATTQVYAQLGDAVARNVVANLSLPN
jgi:integrase